ncbi:MAG: acyl-CoA dehydrogenase, partial [Acidimicrobiia bacterium]
MDFDLTADQEALRSGLRALLVGRFPMETIRAKERAPGCVDPAGWRELVDAGVFSLRLPEDRGGVGLGMAEAVLVFEELGRSLVPGPLVATHLAAGVVPGSVVGLVDLRAVPLLVEHFEALDTLVLVGDDGIRVVEPDRVEA